MAHRLVMFSFFFIHMLFVSAEASVSALKECEPFNVILPVACSVKMGKGQTPFSGIPNTVVFLHTVERTCHNLFECCRAVQKLQDYHVRELGWSNIGFNFLVGSDGRVYVGRGWTTIGQFSLRYNDRSLSVAFIGNFYYRNPAGRALDTARRLLECAVTKGYLTRNYTLHMHEDIECTRNPAPVLQRKVATWLHYEGKVKDYIPC